MENTIKRIMNAVVAVCLLTAAMVFAVNGCKYQKKYEQIERYEQMVQQYDTTTMMNKMVLYPQITELADSITNNK